MISILEQQRREERVRALIEERDAAFEKKWAKIREERWRKFCRNEVIWSFILGCFMVLNGLFAIGFFLWIIIVFITK